MSEPLYRMARRTLVDRIADGTYPPGAMLPSEFNLADDLGVSQGTARKAIGLLEQDGIVQRRQGKGTFVTLRTPEDSLFRFFRLRDADGQQIVPELMSEKVTRRNAHPTERETLTGNPTEVFEITRQRGHQGHPVCVERSVVSTAMFPGLDERAPLPNTMYVLFQRAYACVIIRAEDALTAGRLGRGYGNALDLPPDTPVIIADRVSQDLQGRVVEFRHSIYLTDRAAYHATFD